MAVFYHYTNSENLISIVKEEKLRCSDGAGFSANSVESVFLTRKVWNKYFLQLLFVNIQVCGYLIYYKSPGPGIVNLNSHYIYLTQQTFSSSTCPKIFRHQIHGQHKRNYYQINLTPPRILSTTTDAKSWKTTTMGALAREDPKFHGIFRSGGALKYLWAQLVC